MYSTLMGKRGPKPKFTDVACPNESCQYHLVVGQGNVVGNGTYRLENSVLEDTSAAEPFVIVQILTFMGFELMKRPLD